MSLRSGNTRLIDASATGHPRAQRFAFPHRLRRTRLQPGASLGWSRIAPGRPADDPGAGKAHAQGAMAARARRLVCVSVQREEDADGRRLNDAAPDTPVYVVFAYSEALLNRAGVHVGGRG
jgi:hypothetical protein